MKKVTDNKQLALVWKEDKFYVAKSLEVEVASQGKSKKEALANLKEALELYYEDNKHNRNKSSFEDLSIERIPYSYA